MKILHVITSLSIGGAENFVVNILPCLKRKGHDVAVAIFRSNKSIFEQRIMSEDIDIFKVLPDINNPYSIKRILPLRKILREFEVIHTHTTPAQYITALAAIGLGKKLITTEHSTNNRRRSKTWLKPIELFIYSHYDKIVGCGPEPASKLKNYLGQAFHNNVMCISNGIPVKLYRTAIPSADLQALTDKGAIKILMIGRFQHPKNQITIIRSLKLLDTRFHVLFAGDGPNRTDCESLAEELHVEKNCHFLGNRADIPNVIKAADIMVHSSYWEGLPLSIVEGMAGGLPIIASNVNGIKELVTDCGLLFPVGDEKALAENILRLTLDKGLFTAVKDACQKKSEEFDLDRTTDEYLSVYYQ